jgi:hypothetical protein
MAEEPAPHFPNDLTPGSKKMLTHVLKRMQDRCLALQGRGPPDPTVVVVDGLRAKLGKFWIRYGGIFIDYWNSLDGSKKIALLRKSSPYIPSKCGDTTVLVDGNREDVSVTALLLPEVNIADLIHIDNEKSLIGVFMKVSGGVCLDPCMHASRQGNSRSDDSLSCFLVRRERRKLLMLHTLPSNPRDLASNFILTTST